MKKRTYFMILLLTALLCLSLVSCNSPDDSGKSSSASNEASSPVESTPDASAQYTEGLVFELNADGNEYAVTEYTGKSTDVVIPQDYNGYPVTTIGAGAFAECTSITSVSIPEGVVSIGDYAFSSCSSLKTINIPNSVTLMGELPFNKCDALTYNEHKNILYLGNETNKYVALAKVKSTTMLSYIIHEDTKFILDYAFFSCRTLQSIVIPNGVTYIGLGAFIDCGALTTVKIPKSVTSIMAGAFNSCFSLSSINIPDSVTYIPQTVFYACRSLTSVVIPDGVTFIGPGAFSECISLKSVTIPASVTSIRFSAFGMCPQLTKINFKGTEEQWSSMIKETGWDTGSSFYTVHFADGDIE